MSQIKKDLNQEQIVAVCKAKLNGCPYVKLTPCYGDEVELRFGDKFCEEVMFTSDAMTALELCSAAKAVYDAVHRNN